MGKPWHGEFQRADEVMAQRAQVALVVELQEARAEIRHVHLDGTLPGAGLAGQAAGHGLVHLVREVRCLLPCGAGIAPALPEAAQEPWRIARQFQHVHAGIALQAQPFAHQRGTPLGRVLALAGGFPRRAHGVVGVIVVAGAVAVAVHGGAIALPDTLVDLPVVLAARGHAIDLHQLCLALPRRGNLARVDLVVRVEGGLELLQRRIQLTEIRLGIFRAHALAVLAPQQAAVALRKGCHRIADRAHQCRVLRILHVQRRAHVQHAGVHVAEHAVLQAVTVQQCAELGNVFRQVLGGHGRVFHEGLRPGLALHVAQQAHGTLAHGIDTLDGVRTHRQRVAQTAHGGVGLQVIHEALHARVHLGRVIAAEFHQVDAQCLLAFLLREIFRHAVPDEIVHGQQQHLGIHRLDGQGLLCDQRPGVAQRIHEGGIAHVHQHRILRDGQHVEPRLHHEAQ